LCGSGVQGATKPYFQLERGFDRHRRRRVSLSVEEPVVVFRRSTCLWAAILVSIAIPAFAQQAAPPPAQPGAPAEQMRAELDQLRREFDSVRESYGARLAALEAKIAALPPPAQPAPGQTTPVASPPVQTSPPGEATVPPGAAGAGGPQGPLPVYGGASASSKIFNPDISVIGNFLGAAGKNDISPSPAFEMSETEATFQAVVDPYARADFFFSFSSEGVEIEEGFITFPTLPGGLLAKVGKFKEQIGKVNTLHAHVLPWVDEPIVLQNLLGGEEGVSDSGISVSKLVLNPLFFLEATGEMYQGSSGLFSTFKRGDVSWVGRLRGYRDVSESTNVDVGTSIAYGNNEVGQNFNTRIVSVDATVRYRPLQRAIYRRFMGRTELFWSKRDQLSDQQQRDAVSAFGMYASGDYQFARRWFAGARYDWSQRAYDTTLTDKGPSLVLTYWPSEFSQIRGQYRRTRYAEGSTANELLFQFLFAIGAHGAHVF
jgi:hypothetical protein